MGFKHHDDTVGTADSARGVEAIDRRRRRIVESIFAMTGIAALPPQWRGSLIASATAATPQLSRETLNAVAVFFAPGADPFSQQQGEVSKGPGAIEAGAGEGLYQALNFANRFAPDLADTVANIFNSTASAVSTRAMGPFESPFANLSF